MKEKLITVRIAEDKHAEFKVAADLIGASMSALIHQYIFKVIKEQRGQHPEAFTDLDTDEESKPLAPKVIQPTPRQRDKYDEAIDTAYAHIDSRPLSDESRAKIRKILKEEQGKESP